jgi:outer membrane protein assembly factor BamA
VLRDDFFTGGLARAAFGGVLCVAAPFSAPQQPPVEGPSKLAQIHIVGSQRYAEPLLVPASGLTAGQVITREAMQAAADRLGALGVLRNVRYNFRSQADKVELTFQVEDAPVVPAYFDNFPWFTDEELHAAIRAATPLYDGKVPEAGWVLETATATMEKLIPQRTAGTVTRELVGRVEGEGLMMRFVLNGPALKVNGVQFEQTLAAASPRLKLQAQELVGKPYSRFAIDVFLQEHVRPLYEELGHLRAVYGPPKARFTGDPTKPLADNVLVLIPVEPGAVYRWGGVKWSGNAAFGPAALDTYVQLPVGEPANGLRVLALWQRVENEYGRRGYVEVKLQPVAEFDEAQKRVTYRVAIDEGQLYRMGELVITGLSPLARRKLLEAWTLPRGAVFDKMYFEEFVETGVKKAFTDYVVHYEEPIGRLLRPNADTRTVDVLLDFK